MDGTIKQYTQYLETEKKMAENSRLAYEADIAELEEKIALLDGKIGG